MSALKLKLRPTEGKEESNQSREARLKAAKPKKKKKFMGGGLKIIDPDAITYGDSGETENPFEPGVDQEADELPQIVELVDDRPLEVKLLEEFRQTNKWKTVTEEQPLETFKIRKHKKAPSVGRGNGSDSDLSPPRHKSKQDLHRKTDSGNDRRKPRDSESDPSPPRRKTRNNRSDSDPSPPRKQSRQAEIQSRSRGHGGRRSDSDPSPPRNRNFKKSNHSRRDDSDASPPRRERRTRDSRDRNRNRQSETSKRSPRRAQRKPSPESDPSPPRIRHQRADSDPSPPRRRDSRRSLHDRTSRASPLKSANSRGGRDSRNDGLESKSSKPHRNRSRSKSDSDPSPPRRPNRDERSRRNESSVADGSKRTKTLDGKKAGLQTADALKGELDEIRRIENERFSQMDAEVTGRYAKTKVRDRATGKERDFGKEMEQQKEEQKKLDERKKQYEKWGKGLQQVQDQQERLTSALHEMAKPLARYKDDEDLDEHLKNIDREGDPMLKFLSKKRSNASGSKGPVKPKYEGPAPQPNRFNVWPGYRWDGVDRSNGYEKDWFAKVNSRKALQEESYKWSVEDL